MTAAPASVEHWERTGEGRVLSGYDCFVVDVGPHAPDVPVVLVLHGFPGSTHDERAVIAALRDRIRFVALDLPGSGLSAKPADGTYSMFTYATVATELVASLGIERAWLYAHDMGTTVAAELLHRHSAGELAFDVAGCLLTNGSIFIEQAHLTDGQHFLLALPDERLPDPMPDDAIEPGLAASFPPGQPSAEEMAAMLWLIRHDGGDQLLPRVVRYIEERREHQPRWSAAYRDFSGPLHVGWGELDPIAVVAMVDTLVTLRAEVGRETTVTRWADVGHWPSIEAPDRVAALVAALVEDG